MTDDDEQPTAWSRAVQAHEASLTIGTRVLLRINPECVWTYDDATDYTDHRLAMDGIVGSISQVDPDGVHRDGHRFVVRFDHPWPTGRAHGQDAPVSSAYLAAAELTVIPWPTPEEGVADTLARHPAEIRDTEALAPS